MIVEKAEHGFFLGVYDELDKESRDRFEKFAVFMYKEVGAPDDPKAGEKQVAIMLDLIGTYWEKFKGSRVKSTQVENERAVLTVVLSKKYNEAEEAVTMVKEDGRWKMTVRKDDPALQRAQDGPRSERHPPKGKGKP